MSHGNEVQNLLKEYHLELDDVRWYASIQLCNELLGLNMEPKTLIKDIWSGKLESQLYRMEERFLEDLQETLNKRSTDETRIRELMQEMLAAKRRRAAG